MNAFHLVRRYQSAAIAEAKTAADQYAKSEQFAAGAPVDSEISKQHASAERMQSLTCTLSALYLTIREPIMHEILTL